MKTEFKDKPVEFQPVTVQLTFETEQELATFCALSYAGEVGIEKIENGVDIKMVSGKNHFVHGHEMLNMLENMVTPAAFWQYVSKVEKDIEV